MFANKFFGFFGILFFVTVLTFSVLVTATTSAWADAPRIEVEPLAPTETVRPPNLVKKKVVGVVCKFQEDGEQRLVNDLSSFILNSRDTIPGSTWGFKWRHCNIGVFVEIARRDDYKENRLYNPVEIWNILCPDNRIDINYSNSARAQRWTYWFRIYAKLPTDQETETYQQAFEQGQTFWEWVPNPKNSDMPFCVQFANRYDDTNINGASMSSSNNGDDGKKWYVIYGIIKRAILSIPLPKN